MAKTNIENDGSLSLRPKARILKTLGEELISSETVAVIELVKNAYDADAKTVLIRFDGELVEGAGTISVLDDGHGMDMETIRNSWMVIATAEKKKNKMSKSGTRRVLGEKGIGRFSASRIADELELTTKTAEQYEKESFAFFDWRQFDRDELFLDEILFLTEEQSLKDITRDWALSKYSNAKSKSGDHGTILSMSSLKHTWEKKDLTELQRGLSRLVSPFKPIEDFDIYLELPEEHAEFTSEISAPEIVNYPHYRVEGYVEESGRYEITVSIETEITPHTLEGYYQKRLEDRGWTVFTAKDQVEKSKLQKQIECGPFSFELRVWDRDDLSNVIQKVGGGVRSIRKDLDAIAGVNIYRDGFRVLPYGESDNDWLRLDLRRVQNPTRNLSNNQLTGFIAITADENPDLHDRSNREGLDNNSAYSDLQQIMKLILTELETVRFVSKRPEKNHGKPEAEGKGLFVQPNFLAIKESLGAVKGVEKKQTLGLLSQVESDWKKQIKGLQDVLSQYHALATLGGIVDKILHDGRQPLASIQTEAGLGYESTEDLLLGGVPTSKRDLELLNKGFRNIVSQSTILHDVFRRVEPFGGRKRGRPKKYYIETLIVDTFSLYQRELNAASIEVSLPESETLVTVDTTELSEIFTNLITNSIYWLNSVSGGKRTIQVLISRLADNALEILFSDNGLGVEEKYKDHIFEPYFSAKPSGHGLGLALVGEIVQDYYGGSVELMDSGSQRGATFRIVLRKRV